MQLLFHDCFAQLFQPLTLSLGVRLILKVQPNLVHLCFKKCNNSEGNNCDKTHHVAHNIKAT
jgi:hypothetical protein